MTSKTFTSGTVVDSAWLNDVNTSAYTSVPALQTKTANLPTVSAFAGTMMDDADAAAVRTTIGAQVAGSYAASGANSNITSLSAITSVNTGQLAGMRNVLINGDFRIFQRGSGIVSQPDSNPTPGYVADRWYVYHNNLTGNSGTTTFGNGPTGVSGMPYSTIMTITGATNTLITHVSQRIEAANCRHFVGQAVTLSYWVFQGTGSTQTITPKLGYNTGAADVFTLGTVTDITGTGNTSVPNNTWTKLTRTFTVPSGSTAVTGLVVDLAAVTLVTGATISFALVQLEIGAQATPFEQRPYGTELALCQRYYESSYRGTWQGYQAASINVVFPIVWRASKRATPTVGFLFNNNINIGSPTLSNADASGVTITALKDGATGVYVLQAEVSASAEL